MVSKDNSTGLAGSVRAGQAIFLYAADTIFARGKAGSVVSSFLASSVFAKILRKHLPRIPLLPAALQFLVRLTSLSEATSLHSCLIAQFSLQRIRTHRCQVE